MRLRPSLLLLSVAAQALAVPEAQDLAWQRRAAMARYLQQNDARARHDARQLLDLRGRLGDAPLWQAWLQRVQEVMDQRDHLVAAAARQHEDTYQAALRTMNRLQNQRRQDLEPLLETLLDREPHPDPVDHLAWTLALTQEFDHFRIALDPDPEAEHLEAYEHHQRLLTAWHRQAQLALIQASTGQDAQEALEACRHGWEAWRQARPGIVRLMAAPLQRAIAARAEELEPVARKAAAVDPRAEGSGRALADRILASHTNLVRASHQLELQGDPVDQQGFRRARGVLLDALAGLDQTLAAFTLQRRLAQAATTLNGLDQTMDTVLAKPPAPADRILEPLLAVLEQRARDYRALAEPWVGAAQDAGLPAPEPAGLEDRALALEPAKLAYLAQARVWRLPEDVLGLRALDLTLACGRHYLAPTPEARALAEACLQTCAARRQAVAQRLQGPAPVTLATLADAAAADRDPSGLQRLGPGLDLLWQPWLQEAALAEDPDLDPQVRDLDAAVQRLASLRAQVADQAELAAALGRVQDPAQAALDQQRLHHRRAGLDSRQQLLRERAAQHQLSQTLRARAAAARVAQALAAGQGEAPLREELDATLATFEYSASFRFEESGPELAVALARAEQALRAWRIAAEFQNGLAPGTPDPVRALHRVACQERRRHWETAQDALRRACPDLVVREAEARADRFAELDQNFRLDRAAAKPDLAQTRVALQAFQDGVDALRTAFHGQDPAALQRCRDHLDEVLHPAVAAALLRSNAAQELAWIRTAPARYAFLDRQYELDPTLPPGFRQRLGRDLGAWTAALEARGAALAQDPAAPGDPGDPLPGLMARLDVDGSELRAWSALVRLIQPHSAPGARRDLERGPAALAQAAQAILAGLDGLPPEARHDPALLAKAGARLLDDLHAYQHLQEHLQGRR